MKLNVRLVDLRKVTASCNQCVEFRVAQRVPVPCVLVCDTGNSTCGCASVSMCSCSRCGAVRAQSSLPVSSVHGCGVWGAARSHDQKVKRLPTLRGGPAQRPHQKHLPTSWAPVQRESRTVRPISLAFLGVQQNSRLSIYSRDSVDRAASAASSRKRVSTPC